MARARRRKWVRNRWVAVGQPVVEAFSSEDHAGQERATVVADRMALLHRDRHSPVQRVPSPNAAAVAAQGNIPLPVLRPGRATLENPDLAVTFATVIPPNDFEGQWRTLQLETSTLDKLPATSLLSILVDLSPEMSKGLWDFLRFCNPGYSFACTTIDTGEPYPEAQVAVAAWLDGLRALYGSANVQINRLFAGAWLRGGFFAELVLDSTGAIDLAAPDPFTARFIPVVDPKRGQTWHLGQQVRGQFTDYSALPTVRYVPIDALPNSPYGRPIVAPALFACLFLLAVLRDLRRVIQQHGYAIRDVKVLSEVLRQEMPEEVQADPKKIKEWIETVLGAIATALSTLEPDSAFVHMDSVESNVTPGTTEGMTGMVAMLDWIDKMAVRALKSMPILLGMTDGVSEANANRQWEMHIAGIKAVQHLAEDLFSWFGKLVCQAAGIQANVAWTFAEVRGSEELRDELVREKRLANSLAEYLFGYASHEEAAMKAVGHAPATADGPLLVPKQFVPPGTVAPDALDSSSGGDPASAGGDKPSKAATGIERHLDDGVMVGILDGIGRLEASLAAAGTNGHGGSHAR